MKIALGVAFAGVLLAPLAFSQKLELNLDSLKAKAAETVETNLEGPALELTLRAALQAKHQFLSGTKGVHVRTFEFSKPGAFSAADLEPVLKQVRGRPDWSNVISVKEGQDRMEVFLMSRDDRALAVLVVSAERTEVTVVNIIGSVPLAQAKELVTSNIHYDLTGLSSAAPAAR